MPSIAAHLAVSKNVSSILNIDSDDYTLGNILPDIIDNSHFKVKGKYYLVPDINKFIENNKYTKPIFLGYLTHLLLDKYFLEEFIPENSDGIDMIDLFKSNVIYEDYSILNYRLVKKYKLDVEAIHDIINMCDINCNKDKVDKIITSIDTKIDGDTKFIDYEKYTNFIDSISIKIANEIKRWC